MKRDWEKLTATSYQGTRAEIKNAPENRTIEGLTARRKSTSPRFIEALKNQLVRLMIHIFKWDSQLMIRWRGLTVRITDTRKQISILAKCATALLLANCTSVTTRLDANFNADPLGVPPAAPAPTPPNDVLVWRGQGQLVASTVVMRAGQDRWIRTVPLPAFTGAPDSRRTFLIANTEAFTTSPLANIRGSIRLRLDGLGTVGIGFRSLQGERPLDFVGGFELSNFLPPAGSTVSGLQAFTATRFNDFIGLPSSGRVSSYTPGNVIDINWTLDQTTRTFSASILGGPIVSSTFPATTAGVATTPVQRLQLYIWLSQPTSGTVVFLDNLRAEEYR